MRIGLVTKGSRGDIQPFIALAIGLKNNGHQVTIVTIGSSLKAGTPMVIVSIVADQPFNGKLIEKNKTGVHIPFKKLTFEKLLKGITKVDSTEFKQNAKSIGDKMYLENGVNESLIIIENYLNKN